MKFRTQFQRNQIKFIQDKPSMVHPEFVNDCDIAKIFARMNAGVDITPASIKRGLLKREPIFADFTQIGDYTDMNMKILEARNKFDQLPSEVRKYFGYDPGALIQALDDPNEREILQKFGIVAPDKKESAIPVASGTAQVDKETKGEESAV